MGSHMSRSSAQTCGEQGDRAQQNTIKKVRRAQDQDDGDTLLSQPQALTRPNSDSYWSNHVSAEWYCHEIDLIAQIK